MACNAPAKIAHVFIPFKVGLFGYFFHYKLLLFVVAIKNAVTKIKFFFRIKKEEERK